MQALALTHDQLRAIATLSHAASRDDMTPVITGVHLEVSAGIVTAVATDRYRVAELTFPAMTTDETPGLAGLTFEPLAGVIIPAPLLARTVKQLPRRSILPTVATIAVTYDDSADGRRLIRFADTYAGFDTSDQAISGNYPPVARLFPADVAYLEPYAGGVGLNAGYLATLDKLALPGDLRGPKVYSMHTQAGDTYAPNKPKPVLFTRGDVDKGGMLRYLLQPNLILR
jgi:hypothetical protein